MKRRTHKSEYFYGNKISAYGLQRGYLDYGTLAKAFDAVLVNDIAKLFGVTINGEYNEPWQVSGFIGNTDEIDETQEIYQYYIISDNGAAILADYTNDPIYYIPVLDCHVWGVTHFGTSWDYVLTDVKLDFREE